MLGFRDDQVYGRLAKLRRLKPTEIPVIAVKGDMDHEEEVVEFAFHSRSRDDMLTQVERAFTSTTGGFPDVSMRRRSDRRAQRREPNCPRRVGPTREKLPEWEMKSVSTQAKCRPDQAVEITRELTVP